VTQCKPVGQVRGRGRAAVDKRHRRLAVHHLHLEGRRRPVPNRGRPVVRHKQVQVPIAINVRQRHRHAAGSRGHPGFSGDLGETPLAVIEKDAEPVPQRGHQQVQVTIPVQIGKGRPGRVLARAFDSCLARDIDEPPVAEVAVEHVVGVEPAEVEVAPAVAVDVAGGDA
jgi:hypothetical protein